LNEMFKHGIKSGPELSDRIPQRAEPLPHAADAPRLRQRPKPLAGRRSSFRLDRQS